jgi:outer membrane protein
MPNHAALASSSTSRARTPRLLVQERGLLRSRVAPLLAALAIGAAVVASPGVAEAQAQSKIAIVDVRRAVLETEEGLRVQATLKKLFDSRQVELDNKQRQLQQEKDALDKEAAAGKSSKDAVEKKFEKLQKAAGELQALIVEYQNEMRRKEQEMTNPILTKVMGLVRRIAQQEGYEVILDKPAVPYFRSDLEITDRAIQMYNSGQAGDPAPGGKPGAPAKPGAAPAKPGAAKPAPAAAAPKK